MIAILLGFIIGWAIWELADSHQRKKERKRLDKIYKEFARSIMKF